MTEIPTIIAVSIFAFLATNMDNFAILSALFARYRDARSSVFAGHLLAVGLTLLAAGLLGEAANAVPVQYLGYLGIVPIAMGLYWMFRWFYPGDVTTTAGPGRQAGKAMVVTFLSLLSNSTDTLLTQAVVFADTTARLDWLIAVSVFAVAACLALAAYHGVRNPRIGPVIEAYASRIAPFIMIGVGTYVLANTATDVLQ